MAMFVVIIRILAGLIGALALYLGFFTYEDEEGAIQDRIERFWISINDRQKQSGARIVALFQKVAELLDRFFDQVFGKKLLSLQAISVTMCYSLAGLFLIEPREDFYTLRMTHDWSFIGVLLFAFMGTLPAFAGFKRTFAVVSAPLFFSICFFLTQIGLLIAGRATYTARLISYNILPLALSFGTDTVAISLLRRLLRSISRAYKVSTLVFGLMLQAVFTCLITISIWLAIKRSPRITDDVQKFIVVPTAGWNIGTEIVALAFLLVLMVLLVHKLFWPLFGRLVYPLARFKIARNRPLMASLAVLLGTVAMPGTGAVLDRIVKLFH